MEKQPQMHGSQSKGECLHQGPGTGAACLSRALTFAVLFIFKQWPYYVFLLHSAVMRTISETVTETRDRTTDRNADESSWCSQDTQQQQRVFGTLSLRPGPVLGCPQVFSTVQCGPQVCLQRAGIWATPLIWPALKLRWQQWLLDSTAHGLRGGYYYVKKISGLSSGKIDLSWVSRKRRWAALQVWSGWPVQSSR